jgi:DNA-binding MarR family transcriptional regulator
LLLRESDFCKDGAVTRATADEPNLGLLLFIPYRAMESAVLAELKRHGHEMSVSQARVFQRIAADGSRMADLADAAQVSKQTLTSIVDQLERRGWVRRTPDPADARARLVTVTDEGRALIELGRPVVEGMQRSWEQHLGVRRTAELRRTLADLRTITDPYLDDD